MLGDEANLLPTARPLHGRECLWQFHAPPMARVVARVTNLFNTDYATFGLLGQADKVLGDEFDDARFLRPGAPRAAWVGVEFSFP